MDVSTVQDFLYDQYMVDIKPEEVTPSNTPRSRHATVMHNETTPKAKRAVTMHSQREFVVSISKYRRLDGEKRRKYVDGVREEGERGSDR
jgi:hypothetical protein